ncbi:MAG: hypothetical protein GC145_00030 [Caulobacter sp.]|nr:hypothetical protein [Caulobacter sp.]
MIALALSLLLLAAQAAGGDAPAGQTPANAPPVAEPAATEAAAAVTAPPKAGARLNAILTSLKGQSKTALTSKLGPPESVNQGTDGQVLFWSVTLPGETVCGTNAAGALVCGRQGGGVCGLAVAFKDEGGLSIWKVDGDFAACEAAADLIKPAS